jgi:hypothetical protein
MGALPQTLEIILKCKGKGVMKLNLKKKAFQLTKHVCFSVSLDPSYFQTS